MIARAVRVVVGFASLFLATLLLRPNRDDAAVSASHADPASTTGASPATSWLRPILAAAVVLLVAGALGGGLILVSGIVPIKASSGHWAVTEMFLQFAKRRSVSTHAWGGRVPPLDDPALVQKGAAHFEFGCRPCHGSPQLDQPRVAAYMTPRPPDLRRSAARYNAEELFYIVKHGIKLTGMPAWPSQRRDDEVWAMVAFLRMLPTLEPGEYSNLAAGQSRVASREPIEDLLGARDDAPPILGNCARCHGIDGLGRTTSAFPRLAGQRAVYLLATLQAYARAERHSGIMEPLAAGLDGVTMRRIAEHYSRQRGLDELPAAAGSDRRVIEVGRAIATTGFADGQRPACASCHGPGARRRNQHYPRLAGQYADYIVLQLSLFKAGRRGGTAYAGIMRKVAEWLTDEQMRAVAEYYASLPADTGLVR